MPSGRGGGVLGDGFDLPAACPHDWPCDAAPFYRAAGQHRRGLVTHTEVHNRFLDEAFQLSHRSRHTPEDIEWQRVMALELVGPNPFRPVAFDPSWRTPTAERLARVMHESRDFTGMPVLAVALQDAGCDNDDLLTHCRSSSPHVRGCWVVDLVLG